MSERPYGTEVSFERPARVRPSWPRRLMRPMIAAALLAAIIGRNSDIASLGTKRDCAAQADNGQAGLATQACLAEYRRTGRPMDGMRYAATLVAEGNFPEAKRVAALLLATAVRGDALQLLGQIAYFEERLQDAAMNLGAARDQHRKDSKLVELARDDGVLAMVDTDRTEFVEALQLIEECITDVQEFPDNPRAIAAEDYCHTVAARTLIQAGYFDAAEQELTAARRHATTDKARIDLDYQQANLLQEKAVPGLHAQAIQAFKDVLERLTHTPDVNLTLEIELNLAYSYAEQGASADAQRHLKSAALLDTDHAHESEQMWAAAQIAYRQHDLTLASSLIDKYFEVIRANANRPGDDEEQDPDQQLEVETLRTRIELELEDRTHARIWAQRAVNHAERIRSAQSVLELRPRILAKRRACYELLFTVLARSGEIEAAAMAFDQWQGRTVQDALTRPRRNASKDLRDIVEQVATLQTWLRTTSKVASARSADREAVMKTMRGIDLLALIVANEQVWLLTANHGPPRLVELGRFQEINVQIAQFHGDPTNPQLAAALGARLVPEELFRATRDALHVVVDGRLGPLPVAALRRGGVPLIARRPVLRMFWLPEVRCVPRTPAGPATVISDPAEDLHNARIEGAQIAARLRTVNMTGPAATKKALFAATGSAVLHVATHGAMGLDSTTLVLADRDVSAAEISARQLGPSLVVLSICNSATSSERDLELAGSLAAGFLGAGSQRVVATLRSVTDIDAFTVSTRFYDAGGIADPARALARVQAELATTDNRYWPYFTVFGPDVCREEARESP